MTQLTKEEIKKRIQELDEKLLPEERLALLKELNIALEETNNAVSDFIQTVKENTLKKEIGDLSNN